LKIWAFVNKGRVFGKSIGPSRLVHPGVRGGGRAAVLVKGKRRAKGVFSVGRRGGEGGDWGKK